MIMFRFSEEFFQHVGTNIGVTSVLDLAYVYSEPDLMKELKEKVKLLEYSKFMSIKDRIQVLGSSSGSEKGKQRNQRILVVVLVVNRPRTKLCFVLHRFVCRVWRYCQH